MKKLLALILTLIMAVSLVACGGNAADEVTDAAYIEDKGTLTIGMTLFAPMDYMVDGELTGFEADFGKAVCEKLGLKADFVEINWYAK